MAITQALGEQRAAEVRDGTIAYREHGEGPPIVFLHGLIVNGDHWRKVARPLSERGFRCIVPDLPLGSHRIPMSPGADLTPPGLARTVAALLEALDLSDVTLVANDTGGAIAQLVVTRHPGRIGKLVLLPCDAFEVFPPPMFKYLVWLSKMPGAIWTTAQTMRIRSLRRVPIAYGWLAKRPIPHEVTDAYLEPLLRNADVRRDVAKALAGLHPRYTMEAAQRLGEFSRPVLLAWATEDRVFPFRLAERLQRVFPDATLEGIEDSYTFVPEDQPERLVELVASFAARA